MKYYCFICDTPYHLLTCLNLYIYLKNKDCKADIFIGDSFRSHVEISSNLRRIGIFDDVIDFQIPHYYKDKIKWIESKVEELIAERKYLIKSTDGSIDFKRRYTDIFFAYNNTFSCVMRQIYPNALMHFYEDGTSTYLGYAVGISCIRKMLYLLTKKHLKAYKEFDVFVNNRELYLKFHPEQKIRVKQLPSLYYDDIAFQNILDFVFTNKKTYSYSKNHIIFLTQPYDFMTKKECSIAKFYDTELELIKSLITLKDDTIVRVHPRESIKNRYQGLKIDTGNNIWEILCAKDIEEDHVLISWCSTAQLVPKLFFNKEPYLIFTFPLIKDELSKNRIKGIEKLVRLIADLYKNKNKNKIIVLDDAKDLKTILNKIKNS